MAQKKKNKKNIFVPLILFILVVVLGAGILFFPDLKNGAGDDQKDPSQDEVVQADPIKERAAEIMADMTLHEKICQLFIVTPEALSGVEGVVAAGEATRTNLQEYPVGGVIYFASNLYSQEQTKAMITETQQYAVEAAGIPLFISVDEEGGAVARCAEKLGTTKFEPMYSYKDQGADVAYSNANVIANDLASLGFNLDFAPVADTWSNPANKVIGTRAYSDDFAQAAELLASAVKGFGDSSVASCLKHFPGHGETAEDSHKGAAYSYKTLEELRQGEFLPFKAGIDAGADMVMTGHITMPEIDAVPATLSHKFTTEILRGELGFDGVVVTDSMAMNAIASYYTPAEASLLAFQAGNDLILCSDDFRASVARISEACQNDEITQERLDESVMRILELKIKKGILE